MRPDLTRRPDRGFILATTLLVVTLLTVMLTASLVMISAEYRTTNGSYATSRSLNFAQSGLQNYFAYSHSLSSATYDSTHYTFTGGYARVVARQIHDGSGGVGYPMWIVYSTGIDTTRTLLNQGNGERTVAQLAYLESGTVPARAAMVAINGDSMLGSGSNPIEGDDFNTGGCTQPSGWGDDTLGLAVGGGASGYYNGGTGASYPQPTGDNENPSVETMTADALLDSTRLDWAKIIGGQYTPDYYGTWPSIGASTYSTHYFTGNTTVPTAGGSVMRGMLIVDGDVTLASGAHWDGIILAGGRLVTPTSTSTSTSWYIHGMIITGLQLATTGSAGPKNLVQRGTLYSGIQWDYCYTRSTFGTQSYLTPLSGTFLDFWEHY